MVNTSVIRQKVDLRRTFHFNTRIHPEVRGLLTSFQSFHALQYILVRLKWKTGACFRSVGIETWGSDCLTTVDKLLKLACAYVTNSIYLIPKSIACGIGGLKPPIFKTVPKERLSQSKYEVYPQTNGAKRSSRRKPGARALILLGYLHPRKGKY